MIKKNYKTPGGEIDIVARDGESIVFIEVKTRRSDTFGKPFESVDYMKQKRMEKSALFYLKSFSQTPQIRFDIISIDLQNNKKDINHIIDAFEMSGE